MTNEQFITLIARMKTEDEFGDDSPPSEDWIATLNDLIVTARLINSGAGADLEADEHLALCGCSTCRRKPRT